MDALATGDVPKKHCGLAATVVSNVLKTNNFEPSELFSEEKLDRQEWLLRLPDKVRHAFKSWI